MPKSRTRRKAPFTPPQQGVPQSAKVSGRWVAPLMVTCFLLGLIYIVVYYIAGVDIAFMNSLGNWNLVIGFALLGAGFAAATQWK